MIGVEVKYPDGVIRVVEGYYQPYDAPYMTAPIQRIIPFPQEGYTFHDTSNGWVAYNEVSR
jgi:hypothetical protein